MSFFDSHAHLLSVEEEEELRCTGKSIVPSLERIVRQRRKWDEVAATVAARKRFCPGCGKLVEHYGYCDNCAGTPPLRRQPRSDNALTALDAAKDYERDKQQ